MVMGNRFRESPREAPGGHRGNGKPLPGWSLRTRFCSLPPLSGALSVEAQETLREPTKAPREAPEGHRGNGKPLQGFAQ